MSDKEQSFELRSTSTSPTRNTSRNNNSRKRLFPELTNDNDNDNYKNKNHKHRNNLEPPKKRQRTKNKSHKQQSRSHSHSHSSKSSNKKKHKHRHSRRKLSDITNISPKSKISPQLSPNSSNNSALKQPQIPKSKPKQRFVATKIIPGLAIDSFDDSTLNSDNTAFKLVFDSNVINGMVNIKNILEDDNKSFKEDIDFEQTEIKLTPKQFNNQSTKRTLTAIDMILWCIQRSNGIHILRNIKRLGRQFQGYKDLAPFLDKKIKTGKISIKQKEKIISMVKWVIKLIQNDDPEKGFVLESFFKRIQRAYINTYSDNNENKNNIEVELSDTNEDELIPLWIDTSNTKSSCIITKQFYDENKNKMAFKNDNDNIQMKQSAKNKFAKLCFSYSPTPEPPNVN